MANDSRRPVRNDASIQYWLVVAAVAVTVLVGYENFGRAMVSMMHGINRTLIGI
ncbi:MAG: hypothetical protein ACREQI_13045 [Candidatus Binataceae bacterium]